MGTKRQKSVDENYMITYTAKSESSCIMRFPSPEKVKEWRIVGDRDGNRIIVLSSRAAPPEDMWINADYRVEWEEA